MQLCNPWTSGDGAEVSIAIGVHRWTGDARLPARAVSQFHLGKKGPHPGPFCVI